MKWIEVFDDDYFHVEYKPDENLIYISYYDGLDFEEIRFPFLNFSEQINITWEKIYEDIAFVVDFNYSKKLLRVSHFINYHFDDEIIINFDAKCIDCKYFNVKNDNICRHPNSDNCKYGELWWGNEEN